MPKHYPHPSIASDVRALICRKCVFVCVCTRLKHECVTQVFCDAITSAASTADAAVVDDDDDE